MAVQDGIRHSEKLIQTGRFDEAIGLLTEMLAEDPDDLSALLNVGIAYTESGENDKAIRALEYFTARDAGNAEAWEALGCAHLRKQEYDRAETFLNRARETDPDNASVLRNLSVLFSRTRRRDESFELLQTAHTLDPRDYLTSFALALAYRSRGENEAARALFEELIKLRGLPETIRSEVETHLLHLSVGW
ncbi:MAG: tetratricopeptide repeat protein [Spirochaeta sp.]|jgi:tetratricopeptide (TPR) repeat protein|nr:tetratricopeptide repeat protein [Spirochaeta sp.]